MGSQSNLVQQVLAPHMWVFYAAFVASFALTPVMRVVACSLGITDKPDRQRKLHRRPVPYLGGIAIFAGWSLGLVVSLLLSHFSPAHPALMAFGVPAGALVVVSLGLLDDVRGIGPPVKLAGQAVAAGLLLASGVGTHATRPMLAWGMGVICRLGGYVDPLAGPSAPQWFQLLVLVTSSGFAVLVIMGSCNATNLMDGLDGLCGGVTAIIAAGFLFLCVHLATSDGGYGMGSDAVRLSLALAMLGAVLGFVPYNFNPASIFMGDTGSMFLGYSCGTLMLMLAEVQSKWFLAAMVIFALPILDTTLAFARRWIAGRPLFSADAKHFHHQLMQRGLSVRKTVVVGYGLTLIFAFLGAAMAYMRTRFAVAFYLVIFACLVVAAYKMGMVHERKGRRRRKASSKPVERVSPAEFAALLASISDLEFRDLLTVTWETGCRPRDLFALQARDIDSENRRWMLPPTDDEEIGQARVLKLSEVAFEITQRRMRDYPSGPLFRDRDGSPWSLQQCTWRFRDLRETLHRQYSLKSIRLSRRLALIDQKLHHLGVHLDDHHPNSSQRDWEQLQLAEINLAKARQSLQHSSANDNTSRAERDAVAAQLDSKRLTTNDKIDEVEFA